MYTSVEHFNKVYGTKEPDITGMKVGDTIIYCGHCGHQRKPNTIGLSKCPICFKTMIVGKVTENDVIN